MTKDPPPIVKMNDYLMKQLESQVQDVTVLIGARMEEIKKDMESMKNVIQHRYNMDPSTPHRPNSSDPSVGD